MITEFGDIDPRQAGFSAAIMLKNAQPYLCIEKFGQSHTMPKNNTKTLKYRRYNALEEKTDPLTEGVTPAGSKLTHTDVETTLSQFGDYIEITDEISDLHEDNVLKIMSELNGEQAGRTLELVKFYVIRAGTNVFYANQVASRSVVNAAPTRADIRRVCKSLDRQDARKITKVLKSSVKYDTHNIGPAYIGLVHTDMTSAIRDMDGFVSPKDYGYEGLENEIGSVEDVRFVKSTMFKAWTDAGLADTGAFESALGTKNNVYPIIIVAKDAYATVALKGQGAITPLVVKIAPGKGDALGQRGSVGWKTRDGTVILNDAWMARLECCSPR